VKKKWFARWTARVRHAVEFTTGCSGLGGLAVFLKNKNDVEW